MTIVEEVRPLTTIELRHHKYRFDTITLTWEERRQSHGRRRTDTGTEFAISLPQGTVLKDGDSLILDSEETIIAVREAKEPVYVIHPGNPQEWAFCAYQMGNRHQSVMIGQTELIFLQEPAVLSVLVQLGIPYGAELRPFTAAQSSVGHAYS